MALTSDLIHVRHLAACGAAGNVVFVEADFDASPCIFMVGFRSGDDEVCAEAGGGKAWGDLCFWHEAFDGPY